MRPSYPIVTCAVVSITLSVLWVGCEDSPNPAPRPSPPPSGPEVVRTEIVGPPSIAPGGSAQYSATQFLSDGSSRPVTEAAWSSSQPSLFQVDATGLVTAQAPFRGEAMLQVVAAGTNAAARRATREILVLPDGTFRLVGTVTEAESSSIPVGSARVEATDDADSSASVVTFATTGPDGRYKLYGVPADARLRVQRDGYVTTVERIQLATHGTLNVQLRLERPRLELTGEYTMMIDAGPASSSCNLPDDLRHRTYTIVIAQNGPQLTVTLTDPEFLVDSTGQGNRFTGVVTSNGASIELRSFRDYYYYPNNPDHPDLVELLPNRDLFVVVGRPTVVGTSAGLSGRVNGWISVYRGSRFPNVNWLSGCSATDISLTPR